MKRKLGKSKKKFVAPAAGVALFCVAGVGGLLFLQAEAPKARWYLPAQAAAGESAFVQNCLVCHGEEGRGSVNWRQRQPDGSFLPPPLNGSAHTWHHPLSALRQTIKKGGAPLGGKMPAFENTLSDEEIDNVIAYFQSQWPDQIYQIWQERVEK